MNCGDIETLLNMQLDGTLEEPERSQLADHLAACPSCALPAREYADMDQLLHETLSNVSVPSDFADGVMQRISAEPVSLVHHKKRSRKGFRWLGGAAVAAALVCGAMVGGFFDQASTDKDTESPLPAVTPEDATTTVVADLFQKIELKQNIDQQKDKTSDKTEKTPAEEEQKQAEEKKTETPAEETPVTYGNGISLPHVAFGGESYGAYALTTLAAIDGCHIRSPHVSGDTVTFYAEENGIYLEYQVSIYGAEPVFVGEAEGLPSPAGLGHAVSGGYTATANDGTVAANQPDGLWISPAGGAAQQMSASGGGSLVSWAADSNKVLFTDANGSLHLYYRAENICLTIHESAVSSAAWSSDCKTIVFSSMGSNGYSCVFKVTVP